MLWRVACWADQARRFFIGFRFVRSDNRFRAEKAARLATGAAKADATRFDPPARKKRCEISTETSAEGLP